MNELRPMRSLMFVPGHRERMVQRALGLGEFRAGPLDVAILDLEDGVPTASKHEARRIVADALGRPSQGGVGPLRYVRIRRALSDDGAADLDAIVRVGIDGLMSPKVGRADEIEWLAGELDARERDAKLATGAVRIIPSIESAAALVEAPRIARAADRVLGLAFGSEDFALDLGLPTTREGEALDLLYARSATVVAAAAAHRLSFDGIFPDLSDAAGLRADSLRGRRLGFAGKTLVHPAQVDIVNEVFSAAPDEIEHARRVVAAYEDGIRRGVGAVALDGQMLDAPVVDRARRVLHGHDRNP